MPQISNRTPSIIARRLLAVIFSTALAAAAPLVRAQTETDARPLIVGQTIEREMKGDQSHSYTLALQAEQFLNVLVRQKGIDVVVTPPTHPSLLVVVYSVQKLEVKILKKLCRESVIFCKVNLLICEIGIRETDYQFQ